MNVLSIGTGRKWDSFNKQFVGNTSDCKITHVDPSYSDDADWDLGDDITLSNKSIFEFLENYPNADFNSIYSERFFEHIKSEEILYLLYLLYETSAPAADITITVPDFRLIFKTISDLDPNTLSTTMFNRKMIECTTEVFNEGESPHKSIWTPTIGKYYLELEGYWKVNKTTTVTLDRRDWYLSILATNTK